MKGFFWAAAFVVSWSSGFVGVVLARDAGSTAGLLAWRYLAMAAILVAVVVVAKAWRVTSRELLQQSVIGVLAHVVFLGGVFGASAHGLSVATVSLVCAMQPTLITVAGRIRWGDRLMLRQGVGLVVGVVAVGVGVGGDLSAGTGLLFAGAGLLGLSSAALLDRRWQTNLAVLPSLCIQVVISAVCFMAVAMMTGSLAVSPTPSVAGALLWLVLLSGIGGYASFVMCLRHHGGAATSLLLYLTPPVTAVWAWVAFHTTPSVSQWLGLTFGVASVLLAWPRPTATEHPTAVAPVGEPNPRRWAADGVEKTRPV